MESEQIQAFMSANRVIGSTYVRTGDGKVFAADVYECNAVIYPDMQIYSIDPEAFEGVQERYQTGLRTGSKVESAYEINVGLGLESIIPRYTANPDVAHKGIVPVQEKIKPADTAKMSDRSQYEMPQKEIWANVAVGTVENPRTIKEEPEALGGKKAERTISMTRCREALYKEKTLVMPKSIPCKDFPEFSIVLKKDAILFGLTKNVKKLAYDNRDNSLLILSAANEEFVQFMTEDFLSDEYELPVFSQDDKNSMAMYFEFVCSCFEKYLGTMLSTKQYMEFKSYYNRLASKVLSLEKKEKEKYYRALELADHLDLYMQLYSIAFKEDRDAIIQNIIAGKSAAYIDELQRILDQHMVDNTAQSDLFTLIQQLQFFNEPDLNDRLESKESAGDWQQEIISPQPPAPAAYSIIEQSREVISEKDLVNVKIKIQFENNNQCADDSAVFAVNNLERAVRDYLMRTAYVKKIGLVFGEKEVYLFASKNSSISIPVLTAEDRHKMQLDYGRQKDLINHYEKRIHETIESIMREI